MIPKIDAAKEITMLVWCMILFALGVTALLDSIFNYGQVFRSANAVMFMLVSLGLLFRVMIKKRASQTEKMEEEIVTLRERLEETQQALTKLAKSTPV
jgi:hypothetical protein